MRTAVLFLVLILACATAHASVSKEQAIEIAAGIVGVTEVLGSEVFGSVLEDESVWPAGSESYKGKTWLVCLDYSMWNQGKDREWIDRETGRLMPYPELTGKFPS